MDVSFFQDRGPRLSWEITFERNSPYPLLLTRIVDMASTITRLSTRRLLILAILVMEDDTAMPSLDPRPGGALMVVIHDPSNTLLPLAHPVRVGHLLPFRGARIFEEASIFGDEPEVGNPLEELVELLWLAAGHDINNVLLVSEDVVQDVKCALSRLA